PSETPEQRGRGSGGRARGRREREPDRMAFREGETLGNARGTPPGREARCMTLEPDPCIFDGIPRSGGGRTPPQEVGYATWCGGDGSGVGSRAGRGPGGSRARLP